MNSDQLSRGGRCLLPSLLIALGLLTCAQHARATTYDFLFDNTDDGILNAPFVGSGTVSFNEAAIDGTYAYNSLSDISMDFEFGAGNMFTEADIVTPLNEILFVISNGGQSLNFSNINPFGTGPNGGAIDFANPTNGTELFFTTEPPGTGGNLDLYFTDNFFGNYGSQLVPEPISGMLALFGMGMAWGLNRRRN